MSPQLEPTTALFTLYYNAMLSNYNLHIYRNEDGAALPPNWLRVPPPLTPAHAPQQQSLMVILAPAGSNTQGSGHQLLCQSLTIGHQKREVLSHP